MAYAGVSKPYKEQFIEVDINKANNLIKRPGIRRVSVKIENIEFNCTIEGVQVGYGFRLFFRCDYCDSRVTKLYLKDHGLKCRHCIDFNYISQQATKTDLVYEFHLMKRYGRMLDPKHVVESIDTPCPGKPKHMHYKTYQDIRLKYLKIQNKARSKWLAVVNL